MSRRVAFAVALLLALAPAAARAQDAGLAPPPPAETSDATPTPAETATETPPPPARTLAPPTGDEVPDITIAPLSTPHPTDGPRGSAVPRPGDADVARMHEPQPLETGPVFFPGPSSARSYQYGAELRYGTIAYHGGQVDSTSAQLALLFPFVADSFLTVHAGASWGNFGRPATAFASGAWTADFGLTLSWIVLSWNSYVFSAQSWFNLEIGADLEGAVLSLRTGSAAGGAVDIQSDFLLSLRPMARIVAMLDPHVSVYLGVSLSWYDLTGRDDFIHGAESAHRPSQLVLGIELTPHGRVLGGATAGGAR